MVVIKAVDESTVVSQCVSDSTGSPHLCFIEIISSVSPESAIPEMLQQNVFMLYRIRKEESKFLERIHEILIS